VKVEMKDYIGSDPWFTLYNFGWTDAANRNHWTLMDIPISSFTAASTLNLSGMQCPFICTVVVPGNLAYTDLVRWTTGVALNTLYANLTDVPTQTSVNISSITWAPVFPSTWNASGCCIKLDFDPGVMNWGIRIYTDNTNAAANPRYLGTNFSTSGMLISVSSTTTADPLGMSWDVEDGTRTIAELGNGVPSSWATGGGFSFKGFIDKSSGTIDTTSLGYVSPLNNFGLLWADHDDGTINTRVWKNFPNYLYFGADFTNARGGLKYKTNMLMIELYYD